MYDIIVTVKGGAILGVDIPEGCPYVVEVRDYDLNHDEAPEDSCDQDENGEWYASERWVSA